MYPSRPAFFSPLMGSLSKIPTPVILYALLKKILSQPHQFFLITGNNFLEAVNLV